MNKKTLILDIEELYRVIPECKVLDGQTFKDIKGLLLNLIEAIEKSGNWEFIQYINNKPSLFIIRNIDNSNNSNFESGKFQELEKIYKDIKNIISASKKGESYVSEPYLSESLNIEESVDTLKNNIEEFKSKTEEYVKDTYIPSVKLPWE